MGLRSKNCGTGAPSLLSAVYQNLVKYEKSFEVAKRAIDINPDSPFGPANLAWSYLFLEGYGDAASTVQQASKRKLAVADS